MKKQATSTLQVGKLYRAKIHFFENGNGIVSGLDGK
jgi:hypothetical protein